MPIFLTLILAFLMADSAGVSCYDPAPNADVATERQVQRCDEVRVREVSSRITYLQDQIRLRDQRMATTGITYDMTLYLNDANGVGAALDELEAYQVEAETLAIFAQVQGDSQRQGELEALVQPLPSLHPLTQIRDRRSMEILRRQYFSQFDGGHLQTSRAAQVAVVPEVPSSVAINRVGAGYCSAGGFISELRAPVPPEPVTPEMRVALQSTIYDRDCQTPTSTPLRFRGRVYEIGCSPNEEAEALSLMNFCHPLFFGFFPTSPEGEGGQSRGVGLCHLPGEVTFATGQRRVEQANRECGLLSDGFLSPRLGPLYPGANNASLQMAAELARENPSYWQRLVAQVRSHCGTTIRRNYSGEERTSCADIQRRIEAIESLGPDLDIRAPSARQ